MHHAYLEGAQPKLKHKSFPLADILWREGEHCVVDSEQWDEQQSGAGQPSVRKKQTSALGTAELGNLHGRGPVISPGYPSVPLFTDLLGILQWCKGLGVREPTKAQGS